MKKKVLDLFQQRAIFSIKPCRLAVHQAAAKLQNITVNGPKLFALFATAAHQKSISVCEAL
ncbi:hypothetical protein AB4Z46_04170 [Variovorax sp. M-6]|uniref:hypothetical protein n=1 Tax=Variovorax sp. M-6 TaxID=3233041 RepID=UPI003F9C6CBB